MLLWAGLYKLYQTAKRAHGVKSVKNPCARLWSALYPLVKRVEMERKAQVHLNQLSRKSPFSLLLTLLWWELVTYPFRLQRRLGKEFHKPGNNFLNSVWAAAAQQQIYPMEGQQEFCWTDNHLCHCPTPQLPNILMNTSSNKWHLLFLAPHPSLPLSPGPSSTLLPFLTMRTRPTISE